MCVPPGTAFRDQTICHLSGEETSALSPSSISSSLYSKSSRPEKNSPTKESTTEYKPSLGLYPLSREPFSTPSYNYSDQNTLSFQLSELVGSSGFPVCSREIGRGALTMNNSPVHNPLLFLRTPTRPATFHFSRTRWCSCWPRHTETTRWFQRTIYVRFSPNTITRITDSNFLYQKVDPLGQGKRRSKTVHKRNAE